MAFDNERNLDEIGWQILQALQADARLSFAELGRKVGLSSPAVAERVRKLEDAGVITGYRVEIDPTKVGLSLTAYVRIDTPSTLYPEFLTLIRGIPEVRECHHVAGNDSFIIKIAVSSIAHLERVTRRFGPYGRTTTSIVFSSPVIKPGIERPLPQD